MLRVTSPTSDVDADADVDVDSRATFLRCRSAISQRCNVYTYIPIFFSSRECKNEMGGRYNPERRLRTSATLRASASSSFTGG